MRVDSINSYTGTLPLSLALSLPTTAYSPCTPQFMLQQNATSTSITYPAIKARHRVSSNQTQCNSTYTIYKALFSTYWLYAKKCEIFTPYLAVPQTLVIFNASVRTIRASVFEFRNTIPVEHEYYERLSWEQWAAAATDQQDRNIEMGYLLQCMQHRKASQYDFKVGANAIVACTPF